MREKHDDFPELTEWSWYVDDSVLKCKRDKATTILDHLNNIEPNVIKFTKVDEEDDQLAVFDLELECQPQEEENQIQCPLQKDEYQHRHQKEVKPSRKHQKRNPQRVQRPGKSTE